VKTGTKKLLLGSVNALRLAWRDMRGGLRGMRVVLACLALGVGAIGCVGTLRAAIDRGMASEGARLLGGDVAIESGAQPLPDALRTWLAAQGGRVSAIVRLRSLLVAPSGDRMLVEVKAVDGAYPLVGAATLAPAAPLQADLRNGLVADPLILQRLGLHPGDTVRLGSASFRLVAALQSEPDHAAGLSIMGPRAIIAGAALPRTGLIQPGSLVTYEWRVLLPAGIDLRRFAASLRRQFPDTGWRIHDRTRAEPGLDRAVDQTSVFLVLVGLCALLVGGIGVATGVHAWLEGRARTVAILRCVGADTGLIFAVFGAQVLGLCGVGIAIGVAIGALLPLAGLSLFGDLLPLPAKLGIYPVPLALAAIYGLLTAATFALWPLGRAARIPGAALFRDAYAPAGRAGPALRAGNAALGVLLVAVIVAGADDRRFALWFCAGAVSTLLTFRFGAYLAMRLAALAAVRQPVWLRLGVASLYRPGSDAPLLMTSLGLGLATLSTIALMTGNLREQFAHALPARAPTFFFIDIQNDQLDRFTGIVRGEAGVSDLHQVPSLRARIVALNGVPAEQVHVAPDSRWGLAGDRGLTYSATIPEGSKLVDGRWWGAGYAGPPLLSLDDGLAHGWGLHVGDTLRANVLGRDIDFRVANLRAIDWRGLDLNFTLVASPGLLEHAPHMHIATVRTTPGAGVKLLRAVNDALPNVTGIRVADVIEAVAGVLAKLAVALSVAGAVTLVSGALVLAGAIAAGQRRRIDEAVIFKTLGGTKAQIRAAWLVQFGIMGLATGVIAAGLGTLASWALMHFALDADWVLLPWVLCATIFGCMLLMVACGYAGTAVALQTRAAPYLRNR
jgi:putative ABC transport system permease protein